MSEIQLLENYLLGQLTPQERLLTEAKLLLDKNLQDKAHWQQQTYTLVKIHGRMQLKKEIESVQKRLFSETRFESFRKRIEHIFK